MVRCCNLSCKLQLYRFKNYTKAISFMINETLLKYLIIQRLNERLQDDLDDSNPSGKPLCASVNHVHFLYSLKVKTIYLEK